MLISHSKSQSSRRVSGYHGCRPPRKVVADPEGGIWLGSHEWAIWPRYRHGKTEIFPFKHGEDSRVNQLIVETSDGSVLGATPR